MCGDFEAGGRIATRVGSHRRLVGALRRFTLSGPMALAKREAPRGTPPVSGATRPLCGFAARGKGVDECVEGVAERLGRVEQHVMAGARDLAEPSAGDLCDQLLGAFA